MIDRKDVVKKLLLAPIVNGDFIRSENGKIYTGQRYYTGFDPDMTDITVEFYKIIYNKDILDENGRLQNEQYAGDTMCSFNTVANMVPEAGKSKKHRTPYSTWPKYLQDYYNHYHCLANFWILPKKIGRNAFGTLCKAKRGLYDYMDRFLRFYRENLDRYKTEYPDYGDTFGSFEEFARRHFLVGSYVCENKNSLEIVDFSYCNDPKKIIYNMQNKIEKRAESIKSVHCEELFELAQRIGYRG